MTAVVQIVPHPSEGMEEGGSSVADEMIIIRTTCCGTFTVPSHVSTVITVRICKTESTNIVSLQSFACTLGCFKNGQVRNNFRKYTGLGSCARSLKCCKKLHCTVGPH